MTGAVRGGVAFAAALAVAAGLWFGYRVPFPTGLDRYAVWFAVSVASLAAIFGTLELTRRNILRLAGVSVLLGVLLTTLAWNAGNAFDKSNVFEVLSRHGALGVIGVGAALVIITGGIDLSIGSAVGLAAVGFGVLLERGLPPVAAMMLVLLGGATVGLTNGLLVTRLRLQAFLVTLCGMFVFRGLAR